MVCSFTAFYSQISLQDFCPGGNPTPPDCMRGQESQALCGQGFSETQLGQGVKEIGIQAQQLSCLLTLRANKKGQVSSRLTFPFS